MTNNQSNGKHYQFQPRPSVIRPAPVPLVEPAPPQDEQNPATLILPVQRMNAGNTRPPEGQTGLLATQTPPQYVANPRATVLGMRKRRRLALCCAACLVVLVGGGYIFSQLFLNGAPKVTLYRVSRQTVPQVAGGGGLTYPLQRLDITYPFTALILSVFVQPGDKVSPNQQLLQMDLSQVNARYIAQLDGQVAQAYQDMLAAQTYLYSVSQTGDAVVIAQAQQQYSATQANYKVLRSEANASSLYRGKFLSPISGVVVAVNVYPGQSIAANRVMLTIYDESSIIVHANLPLSDYGQIQLNQSAQVALPALPSENYQGKVSAIIPNADATSDTFIVWIAVANIDGNLLPGMDAFVRVQYPAQSLVVPRLAVLNPDQGAIVFIVRQQRAYIQSVQVVGYAGDTLLIGSGLQANDLVVLVGLASLKNGQLVHVVSIEGQGTQ